MDYMLDLATSFFRRLAEIQELEQEILHKSPNRFIEWNGSEPPDIVVEFVRKNQDRIVTFLRKASPISPPTWWSTVKKGVSRLKISLLRIKDSLSGKLNEEQEARTQPPDLVRVSAAELHSYIKTFRSFEKKITGFLTEASQTVQPQSKSGATSKESNTDQSRRVKRALMIWEWKDERSRQMLMELMYRDPQIAADIASSSEDMVPGFITYVAEDLVRFLNVWPGLHWRRQKELLAARTGVEQTFRKEGIEDPRRITPKDLKIALIARPKLVRELALLIHCAVPFSLVLQNEIEEIRRSRLSRKETQDYDAQAAILMHRLATLRAGASHSESSKETHQDGRPDHKEGQGYD